MHHAIFQANRITVHYQSAYFISPAARHTIKLLEARRVLSKMVLRNHATWKLIPTVNSWSEKLRKLSSLQGNMPWKSKTPSWSSLSCGVNLIYRRCLCHQVHKSYISCMALVTLYIRFSYWRVCSVAEHFVCYRGVKLPPHINGFTWPNPKSWSYSDDQEH